MAFEGHLHHHHHHHEHEQGKGFGARFLDNITVLTSISNMKNHMHFTSPTAIFIPAENSPIATLENTLTTFNEGFLKKKKTHQK